MSVNSGQGLAGQWTHVWALLSMRSHLGLTSFLGRVTRSGPFRGGDAIVGLGCWGPCRVWPSSPRMPNVQAALGKGLLPAQPP